MSTVHEGHGSMAISRDAHDAFFRVSGEIRIQALKLAEQEARSNGREVVTVQDIRNGFRRAVTQAVDPCQE